MKLIKPLFLSILLYIFLYNPIFQLLGFGIIKILLLISIIYLIFNKKAASYLLKFQMEIIYTIILLLYSFIISLFGDNKVRLIPYNHLIWFLESFFIPLFIISFFKNEIKKYELYNIVVSVGFIASLITFYLILNPSINTYIREKVIIDSLDKIQEGFWTFRGFSIAESSSYSYGITQGLILSICLVYMKNNIKLIIPILFLFFSILFNARIGFTPIFITIIALILSNKIQLKNILLISTLSIVGFFIINNSSFGNNNETSIKWGFRLFDDTVNLINGVESESNYNSLFGTMVFFPKKFINLLFGEGIYIFANSNTNRASDIGYIIQIFSCGIIYVLLMLTLIWKLFHKFYKSSINKILPFIFIITILIANYKGNAFFISHGFIRLFFLFYIFTVLESHLYKNAINPIIENK